jgi:hypothetical protein
MVSKSPEGEGLTVLPFYNAAASIANQFGDQRAIAKEIRGEVVIDQGGTTDAANSKSILALTKNCVSKLRA